MRVPLTTASVWILVGVIASSFPWLTLSSSSSSADDGDTAVVDPDALVMIPPLPLSLLVYAPGHSSRQPPRGHVTSSSSMSPLPHTYIPVHQIPAEFSWDSVNGTNYLTKSYNQHVPQWCGSCWAHAALSSLADRIKIARHAAADDIHLSIQYLLNCGAHVAGSCLGGSPSGAYQFIQEQGFVPYETCQPYLACSADSSHGFCPKVNTSCQIRTNTCQTCTMKIEPSLHPFGQVCRSIEHFPNATIAEYGTIRRNDTDHTNQKDPTNVMYKVQAEIFARGPVAASLHGAALHQYHGGIYQNKSAPTEPTHSVSIVGWGVSQPSNHTHPADQDSVTTTTTPLTYWIVRNSWGQYFGEMGYVRILAGSNILGIEESIVWATPGSFTTHNWPCSEDGTDCETTAGIVQQAYIDPSTNMGEIQRRLALYNL